MADMINGLFPGELKPTKTIAGCIDIFENAWPMPQNTITMVETQCANTNSGVYWQRATTVEKGVKQSSRTNSVLNVTELAGITGNPAIQNVHNQFNMLLLASTVPYATKFKIEKDLWHEGYNLLKYTGGQEYKVHYDGPTELGRAISAVVYLNDDYEGGELEFPNFNIKIKPTSGTLILFPSNYAYAHIAHPVTQGTKYALVTWIKDRP